MEQLVKARTIVYIHGINQTLPADELKKEWDRALFGFGLSERSRMAYWADRSDSEIMQKYADSAFPLATDELIDRLTQKPKESEVLGRIASSMKRVGRKTGGATVPLDVTAKLLPLPEFMRNRIVKRLTDAFLKDVHEFFFIPERREFMENRFRERLTSGNGPFIVIAHSQGSMIAYDVLSRWVDNPPDIVAFVTIGSPLGLTEVQDQMKKIIGTKTLRIPTCVPYWLNIADPLDPVAFDKSFLKELKGYSSKTCCDMVEWNRKSPWEPHSAVGYLEIGELKQQVQDRVEMELFQPVAEFRIARDLVRTFEDSESESRHEVLIEVNESCVDHSKKSIISYLKSEIAGANIDRYKMFEVSELRHYITASLTRYEIERLAADKAVLFSKTGALQRVWLNGVKRGLLDVSAQIVQAIPAQISYQANGQDIHWAVVDSGIETSHPHFVTHETIQSVYDCCGSAITPVTGSNDGHGHGTHVAGIIAGEMTVSFANGTTPPIRMAGIAPRCKLHIYKALGNDGSGRDSYIIRALDHIWEQNEKAGRIVIHGVNLSLGGPFDPDVYGCGYSPICQELRRLWRQGVLVVIAAGNEGFAFLQTDSGYLQSNMDLSIGDPANLEEAIAVGSVNKQSPHTYGISFFSSRGPTADGRIKPDVVAPGEKIASCKHKYTKAGQQVSDWYVQMSGTSMAAPHVSGMLAAFLSVRREFIGRPEVVKQFLLDHCTDLRRDRNHQGAGLPNLIKMLMNT